MPILSKIARVFHVTSTQATVETTKSLKPIKIDAQVQVRDELFKTQFNQTLVKLNKLIESFNETTVKLKQVEICHQLSVEFQAIDVQFSGDYYMDDMYQLFYQQMIKQIQRAKKIAGQAPQEIHTIDELISVMSVKKTNKLAEILDKGGNVQGQLSQIYAEEQSVEAESFNHFFTKHSIQFLGGKNSKNYTIIPFSGGKHQILKLEDLGNSSKAPEAHLRSQSEDVNPSLIPKYLDRRVFIKKKPKCLVVTGLASRGDLKQWIKQNPAVCAEGIELYSQMAENLLKMIDFGCFFPDAKNSNWLINQEGKLCVADTKSFLFINESKKFDEEDDRNQYNEFVFSRAYSPPEFFPKESSNFPFMEEYIVNVDADKSHAFILGTNLYEFVAGIELTASYLKPKPKNYQRNVFKNQGIWGEAMKDLIQSLCNENPGERMPVVQAKEYLDALGQFLTMTENFENKIQKALQSISPETKSFEKIKQINQLFMGEYKRLIFQNINKTIDKIDDVNGKKFLKLFLKFKVTEFEKSIDQKNFTKSDVIIQNINHVCSRLKQVLHDMEIIEPNLLQMAVKYSVNTALSAKNFSTEIHFNRCINVCEQLVKKAQHPHVSIHTLQSIYDNLDNGAHSNFSIQKGPKASKIEEAIKIVPIDALINPTQVEDEVLKPLWDALAWRRFGFNLGKSSHSYRLFKQARQEETQNDINDLGGSENNTKKPFKT